MGACVAPIYLRWHMQHNQKLLSPFLVKLQDQSDTPVTILFDCWAEDANHAREQGENAYPHALFISAKETEPGSELFVIYSPNEAAVTGDAAGYWQNEFGWTTFENATVFNSEERHNLNLPNSTGNDARWMDYVPSEAQEALVVSLDGGVTFVAASEIMVAYRRILVDGEDGRGELRLTMTREGLISDVWTSRQGHLDHNIGTASETVEEIVTRLVEEAA